MNLGAHSVSLTVRDIAASAEFYAKLGFLPAGGDPAQGWLVLRNGDCTIGIFQDMFDKNILTFNPGWGPRATPLAEFEDIRDLQRRLKDQGMTFVTEADETTTGPAYFTLEDPDGNPILVDQHV